MKKIETQYELARKLLDSFSNKQVRSLDFRISLNREECTSLARETEYNICTIESLFLEK